MPFDPRRREDVERPRDASRPARAGVDRRVAVLALAVAAALVAGLAWNLLATQSEGRKALRDNVQRRSALTADLIGSAFTAGSTPELRRAEFGGSGEALRRAVRTRAATSKGELVTVLDAEGRVLATAGGSGVPALDGADVRIALRGTPTLSDAFVDGRGDWVVEGAIPFPSRSGRRVLLTSVPLEMLQTFTDGIFSTASAFARHGGVPDRRHRTKPAFCATRVTTASASRS